jgi:hypothetical protein
VKGVHKDRRHFINFFIIFHEIKSSYNSPKKGELFFVKKKNQWLDLIQIENILWLPVKSPCNWTLVWPSNTCFIRNLSEKTSLVGSSTLGFYVIHAQLTPNLDPNFSPHPLFHLDFSFCPQFSLGNFTGYYLKQKYRVQVPHSGLREKNTQKSPYLEGKKRVKSREI